MPDDITLAITAVERWIGNPVSRAFLRFVVTDDKCGNRLSNAIDQYLGKEQELCWKCRFAGRIVGYTLKKSSGLFDVNEDYIKKGLEEPIFKRGLMNVLNGIARYGITRPQITNAPFLVVWDFTHRCNLKCKHCYLDAQKALPDELDTEEAKKLIRDLAAAGVVVIAFSGGEPLMRKDFFDIASYAHEQGMYVAVASNGTMITPEIAARLRESGVEYAEISIDGKDAENHDAVRGIDGAFDRSVAGIQNCIAEGIYTCIATTVTQDNYEQVPEIYRLAQDLGAMRMICFNFIPTGRGIEMAGKDIHPCVREDFLKRILAMNIPGVMPEVLSTAPQFARVAVEENDDSGIPVGHFHLGAGMKGKTRMLADFIGGCGAGRLYCSVEPQGDIQPCVFMPASVGNIREQDFLEIWQNAELLKKLRDRDLLTGNCATCSSKYICGGCRARAWSYFHDVTKSDPGCIRNKELWDEIMAQKSQPAPETYEVVPDEPVAEVKA